MPVDTGVTVPDALTVATVVFELLHVPPVVVSTSVDVLPPTQSAAVPVIDAGAEGNGFTVTTVEAAAAPHVLDKA